MKFRSLHRSMFGQIAILTVLFIGWGVYQFAVRPIMDMSPLVRVEPLQETASELRQEINDFLLAERQAPGKAPPLAQQPVMREVLQRNPQFRYYVRAGERSFGNLAAPRYYQRLRLDRLTAANRAVDRPELCSQIAEPVAEGGGQAYLSYFYCGSFSYFEYSGLKTPVALKVPSPFDAYRAWLWSYSSGFLLAVGGVCVIVAGILLFNMRMIRRVARLAQSFDPERLDHQLPEKGLPHEVVPLVRAVNHMIARMDETQRRRRFFLSTAAHEMRTPLTVLRTRLEMLEEGTLKDKLVGDVRRLTNLVNQLLALMSLGGRKPVEGTADLVACCVKVVGERELLACARGIALRFRSEWPRCEVVGEPGLVEVVLANLIDNALSFTSDGGQVLVALAADGELSVRDFGPGIAEDNLDALFEPFVRFPPSRNGYGLGLAIAREIVQLHGGRIHAENAEGGGARFVVWLGAPLRPDPA